MCLETMGLKIDGIISYWDYKFPGKIKNKEALEADLTAGVIALIIAKGEPRSGVYAILEFMRGKKIKIALASSSYLAIIEAVVDKLGIRKYFKELYSAEMEEYGKPHPGVYITTAKVLDVAPERCLAFEDSFTGVLSAKAARMKCVCVPDEDIAGSPKLAIADLMLNSLAEFSEETWNSLNR
jgi:sugar-phosphatase